MLAYRAPRTPLPGWDRRQIRHNSNPGPLVGRLSPNPPSRTCILGAGRAEPRVRRNKLVSWARMRPEPEAAGTNSHLGRGCGRSGRRLLRALGHASTDALPRVLVASCGSARPASQSASFVRRPRAPGVVSCARSVTHRRMRSLACSSPPAARHAPHPNLLRPLGGLALEFEFAGIGLFFAGNTARLPTVGRGARNTGFGRRMTRAEAQTRRSSPMALVTLKQLLEAGVHFGHQTSRWNPKMKRYIFTARNGIHIIDLQQTVKLLDEACNWVKDVVGGGRVVLFVGTKKQAQESIELEARRSGMPYVNH